MFNYSVSSLVTNKYYFQKKCRFLKNLGTVIFISTISVNVEFIKEAFPPKIFIKRLKGLLILEVRWEVNYSLMKEYISDWTRNFFLKYVLKKKKGIEKK